MKSKTNLIAIRLITNPSITIRVTKTGMMVTIHIGVTAQITIGAVSYTHLDVYKRQIQNTLFLMYTFCRYDPITTLQIDEYQARLGRRRDDRNYYVTDWRPTGEAVKEGQRRL